MNLQFLVIMFIINCQTRFMQGILKDLHLRLEPMSQKVQRDKLTHCFGLLWVLLTIRKI